MGTPTEQCRSCTWGLILFLLLCIFPATPVHSLKRSVIKFTRMFRNVRMKPKALVAYKGHYYVTDMRGNRILVFDHGGKLQRTIGTVGSGPGELLRPTKLAIVNDLIYVYEIGNERIQIMTLEGKPVRHFSIGDFEGYAVDSKGRIFLGQPEKGRLISVYSPEGKFVNSFGELRKTSDFYGQSYAHRDRADRVFINRVSIFVDELDNIYVTFQFAPVLQKYDPRGRLIWEARLEGAEIDELVNLFLSDEKHRKYIRIATKDFAANLVLVNTVVTSHGDILTLLPNKVLYVLDKQGRFVTSFDLLPADPENEDFWPVELALGDKEEIVAIVFGDLYGARFKL